LKFSTNSYLADFEAGFSVLASAFTGSLALGVSILAAFGYSVTAAFC